MESKSKEILSLIESSIKQGNADIKPFALNLLSNIKKNSFLGKTKRNR